jgi:hypothetical protein
MLGFCYAECHFPECRCANRSALHFFLFSFQDSTLSDEQKKISFRGFQGLSRLLVENYLAKRHLVERHLVERHFVE